MAQSKDTTGNCRSADKWENLISIYCDCYPECDSTILWSDITDALADTPNNKAPGADGVPSEVWKPAMAEPTPTSPLEKSIQKIINILYDIGDISQCLETSAVVPVPKKGEVKDPDNYRGISMIPTLIIRGVWVPGLTSRIPGLFADEAVILVEPSVDIQAALLTLTEWSGTC
ncbi:hypothetical protein AYI69_g9040 [Smittium culicis]|uniref:Uncharacterized protein n=1 Tax=Smittium culicis TaxID=133412 RepID=A0A1R1XFG8_9FUNG|nr:hypothetical protein AYI69_g9040 [Smittium culicis]